MMVALPLLNRRRDDPMATRDETAQALLDAICELAKSVTKDDRSTEVPRVRADAAKALAETWVIVRERKNSMASVDTPS